MPQKLTPSFPCEKDVDESSTETWEEDQKQREYYYDDSHGYETYDPEKADDEETTDD